jgi:FkbM family methyltransferase
MPGFAKAALWLWVKANVGWTGDLRAGDHWFAIYLSNLLGLRIPIWTRLRNGMKIRVAWNDCIGSAIYRDGYYEPEMVALFEKLLKPGMIFFDVGAHVGQFTLVASRLVGPKGSVHSFEPDSTTFEWLQANVRANGLSNVVANSVALADDTGTKTFYLATSDDIGSNSLRPPSPLHDSGRSRTVNCITLDEYVDSRGITRVDVIKADIEGAELLLLRGARKLLGGDSAPVFILEFEEVRQQAFGYSCVQLADELLRNGYSLFRIGADLVPYTPGTNHLRSFNVLAMPAHRIANVGALSLPVHSTLA